MSEITVTAYLSDGRHISVPRHRAKAWGREAAELDTTIGLADWYTDHGDERQDQIKGEPEDNTRCDHLHREDGPSNLGRVRVVNESQAGEYDRDLPHASSWVCAARPCILDALAWVERATGEAGVWIDEAGEKHTALPQVAPAPVHVGLITWGPDNGDIDEFIVVTNDVTAARRALVAELINAYAETPSVFGDDAPAFMDGLAGAEVIAPAVPQKDLDHVAASDEELVTWLTGFREATTAPWWTITETVVVA